MANMPQGFRSDTPSANLQKVVSQSQAAEMLNVSPRNVATAQAIEGEIKALGERRGNPDFKQDAIVQDFAQLEGKKTIEIAAQQSGLVE